VSVVPITETLRHIAPRRARAELPDHRLDKHAIALSAVSANMAWPSGQRVLNSRKLIVPQSIDHGLF
jgi:hypothetical protein